ncbi:isochorismatase family protein [Pseudomonas syringae pv. actinidiae]|uniref:isochorismatase family protein n=1 Tax=Pseudomonas viridiflava TaxID=33069 RepID=UPI0018E5FF63|nr:isochorismatase family protein [Pseudomonas viridiflava]MBI6727071.1 isochorismatase family protein [Pseudomonas viridiflava]MDU8352918.1 isochorismatase family protein [Pseudomonas syringae pv. actinidiae]
MNINKKIIFSFDTDPQNCFTEKCPNELPVAGGSEIVPHLNYMATFAGFRGASKCAHSPAALWVVETTEEMLQPTGLPFADLTWKPHAVPGTFGFEFIEGLPKPSDYDLVIWKGVEPDMHPYGACYQDGKMSTGLIEWMIVKGIKIVLLGGLAYDYCVKTTAIEMLAAGFKVILYTPATRGIAEETMNSATVELMRAGADICNDPISLERRIEELSTQIAQ